MVDSSVLALIATVLSLVSLVVSGLHCAVRRSSKGVDISARFGGLGLPQALGAVPPPARAAASLLAGTEPPI